MWSGTCYSLGNEPYGLEFLSLILISKLAFFLNSIYGFIWNSGEQIIFNIKSAGLLKMKFNNIWIHDYDI